MALTHEEKLARRRKTGLSMAQIHTRHLARMARLAELKAQRQASRVSRSSQHEKRRGGGPFFDSNDPHSNVRNLGGWHGRARSKVTQHHTHTKTVHIPKPKAVHVHKPRTIHVKVSVVGGRGHLAQRHRT